MNYEEMEQWQLDQLIHNHVVCGGEWAIFFSGEGCDWVNVKTDQSISFAKFEAIDGVKRYDKPENAWSLMVDNGISLITLGDEWEAHHLDDNGDESNNIVQASPGGAVSICFLKMLDAELNKLKCKVKR